MKYVVLFLLALVLSGTVAVSQVSKANTVSDNLTQTTEVKMSGNAELAPNKADELNMIILLSDIVLPVPEKRLNATTPFQTDLSLDNQGTTSIPIRLNTSPIPELLAPDGRFLQPQAISNNQRRGRETNCVLLESDRPNARQVLMFPQKAWLSWQDNQLQLTISNKTGYFWTFNNLELDTYQLRFTYDILDSCYDTEDQEIKVLEEDVTPVRLVTQTVKLRLVKPLSTDFSAIEIDDVLFKILMPEPIIPIPANKPNAETSVKIRIQVTNNTGTSLRFQRWTALEPTLIGPDEKEVRRDSDTYRLWVGSEPGHYSASPGKSTSFVLDGTLYRKNNQLTLKIPNQAGGYWYYKKLEPGRYQLRFTYKVLPNSSNQELYLLTKTWTGHIALPFVEFNLERSQD